jgi:tetratricopeptide (TPR) repeat protein
VVTVLFAHASGLSAQVTVQHLVGGDVSEVGSEGRQIGDAIARFNQRDYDGASELLQAAVKANAQLPPANVLMARLYIAANSLDAARNALQKASIETPNDPEAFVALGEMAFSENRLVEAEPLLAKGLKLCDSYKANARREQLLRIRALAGTAAVQERQEKWAGAEQNLTKWIEIDPNNARARTRLGRTQFEQEKYREAYATFTQLYEKNDSVPRPEVNMALLYEQASRQPGKEQLRENAEKLMNLAVERMPEHLETRLAAAQWGLEAGRMDFAKTNAQAALQIDPDSLPAKIAVGVVARHEGDGDRAEELFTSAHLQSPGNFAAMNHLALTLIERPEAEHRRRALEFAQVNARVYADLRQAMGREAAVTLAWILFSMGREADAMRNLSAAVRAGSVTPESSYYAARILVARGGREPALDLLERLLQQRRAFLHRADAQQLLNKIRQSPSGGSARP